MKKINIFLASSIIEFQNERMAIENFIRNISDKFEEHYNIKLQPLLCENFDDAVSKIRKQEEYNEKIRNSEFCFFVFFSKAGEYTLEEFNVAMEQFKKTGKPKIYTYFKIIEEGKAEQSLYDFMNMLDKAIGHYYGQFEHLDTVKLRILLSLKLEEMSFLEVKTDSGKLILGGDEVMSLDNVAEFKNNLGLKELQERFSQVEKKYFEMKRTIETGEYDDDFAREYAEIAVEREDLIKAIDTMHDEILGISTQMVKDGAEGNMSEMLRQAYRCFEQGDIDGILAVTDRIELRRRRERAHKMKDAYLKEMRISVKEYRMRIRALKLKTDWKDRFQEIKELYEEIMPDIFEDKVEIDMAYDYLLFLYEQNYNGAVSFAENVLDLYQSYEKVADNTLAALYNLCGNIFSDYVKPEKAEEYYLKAIKIREDLAKKNPESFNPYLAGSYNDTGFFCFRHGKIEKAEEYYLKAIKLFENLVAKNLEGFESYLATSYNNAGLFYSYQGQPKKAEEYYIKAIKIREESAEKNPERFEPDLAQSYNDAGVFYYDQGKTKKAEEYYLAAIKKLENLAEKNPDRFNHNLATSYNNVGIFYHKQGTPKKTEGYYIKAIKIYKNLADKNPDMVNPGLANSYNTMGVFCVEQGQIKKAEEYFFASLKIREILAKKNPYQFEPDLAVSYYNFALFKKDYSYFDKALELAKKHPENPYCRQIIEAL